MHRRCCCCSSSLVAHQRYHHHHRRLLLQCKEEKESVISSSSKINIRCVYIHTHTPFDIRFGTVRTWNISWHTATQVTNEINEERTLIQWDLTIQSSSLELATCCLRLAWSNKDGIRNSNHVSSATDETWWSLVSSGSSCRNEGSESKLTEEHDCFVGTQGIDWNCEYGKEITIQHRLSTSHCLHDSFWAHLWASVSVQVLLCRRELY